MSRTITLEIPDQVFQPLQRVARATRQSVESLLLTALQVSLPPLSDLPDEIRLNLEHLESLDDETLQQVMAETVSVQEQGSISELLVTQQERSLSKDEEECLGLLQRQADLVMLRKARAAVLLRLRGKRIPTLAELERLYQPPA